MVAEADYQGNEVAGATRRESYAASRYAVCVYGGHLL